MLAIFKGLEVRISSESQVLGRDSAFEGLDGIRGEFNEVLLGRLLGVEGGGGDGFGEVFDLHVLETGVVLRDVFLGGHLICLD